ISGKFTGPPLGVSVVGGEAGDFGGAGTAGSAFTPGGPGDDGATGTPGNNGTVTIKASASEDALGLNEKPFAKRLKRGAPPLGRTTRIAQGGNDTRANGMDSESEASQYKPVSFVRSMLMLTDREMPAHNLLLAPDLKQVTAHAGSAV